MNDNELHALLKNASRTDRGNPFFVRKVLNRLPSRKRAPLWWVLPAAYILSLGVLVWFWVDYFSHPGDTELGITTLLTLWAMTLLWLYALLRKPLARLF